jgi:hypothetical protein
MGNSNDLYVDSTLVDAFLPLDIDLLADADIDPLVAATFPDAVYG